MKNFVTFLFCILTINYVSHAQTTQRDSIYTLLHKIYDYVECFNDLGLAKVSQAEKYGVLDKTGAIHIPFIYNNIEKINNDNYIVSIANKKGIVNSDNMPILPIIYENILPYTKDTFIVSQNGKYGIIDSKQTILLPLIYHDIAIYKNKNLLVQKDSLMGILNPNMEWVVPLNYDNLYYLYENKTEERYISSYIEEMPYLYTVKQGKKGIIDSLYQTIIPCEYDDINKELTNEVWIVQNKEKYGLIDKYGKTVVNCQYSNLIYDAINQTFIATDSQNREGILDNKGNIVQTFKYKILEAVAKDYYIVRIDTYQITKREIITESAIVSDKAINIGTCKQIEDTAMYIKNFSYDYCFLNIQTQTLSTAYDDLSIAEINEKTLIIGEKNNKQGILTETEEIVLPFIYDNIEVWNKKNREKIYHYFMLSKNSLFGIANNKGKQIISCKYDNVKKTDLEKYVYLYKNNQIFLANIETGFVLNKGYDKIHQNWVQDSVYKNYFFVQYKKKEGIINTLGKEIIPCKYDYIENIGYTFFSLRIQNKYALANGQGKQITDFIYEKIEKIKANNYIVCTQNNQVGLIDSTGKVIIPFSYEKIEIITDKQGQLNYIVGEKEGEMYYFNAIGNKISFPMEENKLYFQKGKGYGYTDKEGKTIIPFNYQIPYDNLENTFDEKGLIILVKPNKTGIIDTNNQIILPLIYDEIEKNWTYIRLKQNNKEGIADMQGNVLIPAEYDYINRTNNYFMIRKNNKYGLTDIKRKIQIPCIYENFSILDNDFFKVKQNNLYGIINLKSEIIIPIIYEDFYAYSPYLFSVKKRNKYSIINNKQTVLFESEHKIETEYNSNKNLLYIKYKGAILLYDNKGIYLGKDIVVHYEQNKSGYYLVKPLDKTKLKQKEHKYESLSQQLDINIYILGLIDSLGNQIIPIIYDELHYAKDGYLSAIKDEKKYKLDKEGKNILPEGYETHDVFSNGLLAAKKKVLEALNQNKAIKDTSKWGFMNEEGKWIIPAKYELVSDFYEGRAVVYQQEKCGVIDTNGKLIIPIIYEGIEILENAYMKVKIDCKFGILTPSGKAIVPIVYEDISTGEYNYKSYYVPSQWKNEISPTKNANTFYNKNKTKQKKMYYDYFVVMENGLFGVVDTTGKQLIPCKYHSLTRRTETDFEIIDSLKKHGLVNLNNEVLIPTKYYYLNRNQESIWEVFNNSYECFLFNTHTGKTIPIDENTFYKRQNQQVEFRSKGKTYIMNQAGDVWESPCE